MSVNAIREFFGHKFQKGDFVAPRGQKTLELVGAQFLADEDSIFGEVDWNYVRRELAWYDGQSRNVNDMENPPKIWKDCASPEGWINSNYGWMIFSESNGDQYECVLKTLREDPYSRRAIMIYTRPSMHYDWCEDGMTDFCCTNTVQYLIRDEKLVAMVSMRSNDAVYGYKNDRAWQLRVQQNLADTLGVEVGSLIWMVGSLHVYERHFPLVEHWCKTGEKSIPKETV